MSLIGRRKLIIPPAVKVSISANHQLIEVKGPLGTIKKTLPGWIAITQKDNTLTTNLKPKNKESNNALLGTTNSLLANWIEGVEKLFVKKLLLSGLGYKITKKNDQLEMYLGHSHPIFYEIPKGIEIVLPNPTEVIIKGIDKEEVGLVASQIRKLKKVEPYKGKGIRYEDEKPLRKIGKTATSAK